MNPIDKLIGIKVTAVVSLQCKRIRNLNIFSVALLLRMQVKRLVPRPKVILAVDRIKYMHIGSCKTPKEAWDSLQTVFDDLRLVLAR